MNTLHDRIMSPFIQYPEQYFDVVLSKNQLSERHSIEDIHSLEWWVFKGELNALGTNPRDNSESYKNKVRHNLLERSLQFYLRKPNRFEQDFLEHLLSLINQNTTRLSYEALAIVNEWLAARFTLINTRKQIKPNKIKPSKFAVEHWKRIEQLLIQNDRNVSKVAKELCDEFKDNHPRHDSLSRAINRICKVKGTPHNQNFQDKS